MEKPLILCYGLSEPQCVRLEKLGRKFGASLKQVTLAEYSLPIAAAAGGLSPRAPWQGEALPEVMLVFVNFPEGMLEVFLKAMRDTETAKGSLKAILTPHNAVWTPLQLYHELCREREAMRKK